VCLRGQEMLLRQNLFVRRRLRRQGLFKMQASGLL
jgi:hypothetical protein